MNTLRKLQKSVENIEIELDKIIMVSGNEGLNVIINNNEGHDVFTQ